MIKIAIKNPTDTDLRKLKMLIYLITNKITGQQYIGKSAKPFIRRYNGCKWWEKPSNKYIYNSVRKYGLENFELSIIEYNIKDKTELNNKEIECIKELNSLYPNGYNYLPGGDSIIFNREISKVVRKTIRKSFQFFDHIKEEIINVDDLPTFCEENNISYSCMNMVSRNQSSYHKQYTLPGKQRRKWTVISPDNIKYTLFEGESKPFCREHGIESHTFFSMLAGKFIQCKGGWRLEGTILRERKVCSPTGEIFTIKDGELRKFCRQQGFKSHCGLNSILLGCRASYKGWTIP